MVDDKASAKFLDMAKGPNRLLLICLGCIFTVGAYHFFSWPISGGADTDLWYHLNGGRYFFEHNKPADSGFFSFIADDRNWANYYWLFQAVVYSIFSLFDYQGLVIFRAAFYLLFMIAILLFLLKDCQRDDVYLYVTVIAVIFFLALIPRYFATLRPHMFSYFLIVMFLLILESRNKYGLFALPLLAVAWCNLHGVEYPVLMLICFAYLAEILVVRIKCRTPLNRQVVWEVVSILLAVYGVFATPFGSGLLFSPFLSAPYQHLYIGELGRTGLAGLISINLATVKSSFSSLSNILLVVALLSCLNGVLTKRMKVSHILLFAGGVFLLTRAYRFRYEFVLLCLPIIRSYPLLPPNMKKGAIAKAGRIAVVAILSIISIGFLHKVFQPKPHYPLSKSNIPAGISAFLNHVDAGGKILNFPGHGGYLQWELNKSYTIFMDLEMMLFTDEDIFMVTNSFTDKNVMAKVIQQHNPGFIAPRLSNRKFKEMVSSFPQYQAVFFDDVAVLYVDRNQHPRVAAENGLGVLDPFGLQQLNIAELSDREADVLLKKLKNIQAMYSQGFLVNQMLVQLYRKFANYDMALQHTEQITKNFPERLTGFQLKGDVLKAQQNSEAALESYKKALAVAGDNDKSALFRKISGCYLDVGQPKKAYRSLKEAVNLFAPGTSYRDYYDLGRLALAAGDRKDGVMFLRFALLKTPEENKKIRTNIQRRLMGVMLKEQGL